MNQLGENTLYIRSMGKALRVTGVFLTDDDANNWIAARSKQGERHGVVACAGSIVLCADMYDRGVKIGQDSR